MKKLVLSAAISTLCVQPVFADGVYSYSMFAGSGTAADPLASFINAAGTTTKSWYVDVASGSASNKTAPPVRLVRQSDWTFDFTNPAAVSFTGNIQMGNYKVQTAVTGAIVADGRQTFSGVVQSFSGIGAYDEVTNTFTYNVLNFPVNGGGASTYSATAPVTCANGQTYILGKVCDVFRTASQEWEGLALSFVFAEDKSSFTGSLRGTNTLGTGISRVTTTINWQISEVPVPRAAWLFGSGLLGLAGARRRRKFAP